MKIFFVAVCAFMFTACGTLEYDYPHSESNGSAYIVVPTASDSCWDEPYMYGAEWCDWYDDGSTCCVWYVEKEIPLCCTLTSYEEWCQWEDGWCWEYNGEL